MYQDDCLINDVVAILAPLFELPERLGACPALNT
jgi:hypothetical protein